MDKRHYQCHQAFFDASRYCSTNLSRCHHRKHKERRRHQRRRDFLEPHELNLDLFQILSSCISSRTILSYSFIFFSFHFQKYSYNVYFFDLPLYIFRNPTYFIHHFTCQLCYNIFKMRTLNSRLWVCLYIHFIFSCYFNKHPSLVN